MGLLAGHVPGPNCPGVQDQDLRGKTGKSLGTLLSMPTAVDLDLACINTIRGLSIDAVQKANSGHPGLPLGAAPMAFTLWAKHLRQCPQEPKWINRDRFILSAGHGSMLLYSLLHLFGFDLSLEDIKNFRQWGSRTPGHPENVLTPGVEMATGPLGQGISTAVGMAIAESHLAAVYNKPGFPIFDHYTFGICSDGDLMEGVAQEACSLAGHLQLGKLIFLYDDNEVTIDGPTSLAYTEDVTKKFESLGWQVLSCDGMDTSAVDQALSLAKAETTKPTLIRAKTVLGYGSPNKAGLNKAHGDPLGAEELKLTKEALGIPLEPAFYVDPEVARHCLDVAQTQSEPFAAWTSLFEAYRSNYPEEARAIEAALNLDRSAALANIIVPAEKAATRALSGKVINGFAQEVPGFLGGGADLTGNVNVLQSGLGTYSPEDRTGRTIHYGIREHAMCACINGITLHGAALGFGGTFLIFSDYCKPPIRLAALMEIPSVFVFTHDSIGLGEDGPTHQPIEQLAGLRAIPNCNVVRPADGAETAAAWRMALQSRETPTVMVLTRQAVPPVSPELGENHPAMRGGYVLKAAPDTPDLVIVATGSEVSVALGAAELVEAEGYAVQVVSLPSFHVFDQQDEDYRKSVFPPGTPTLSVEAASTFGWGKYAWAHVGIDRFGASAPGDVNMREFGFTAENVATQAKTLLQR